MTWLAIALIGTQFVAWLITRAIQTKLYDLESRLSALELDDASTHIRRLKRWGRGHE